jgi:probable rRNA maturation factor
MIRVMREARLDPAFPLSRHEFAAVIQAVMEALGLTGDGVEVKLVDDREIARLNAEFMGCPGPTNVLSFPAAQTDDGAGVAVAAGAADDGAYLGELALSVDTLAREAALYGQPPEEHLARLLAHGMLHLAGYDHGPEMDDLTDAAVDHVVLILSD